MGMASQGEVEVVACLEVLEKTSNGAEHRSRIPILRSDYFILGRSPQHCRRHWADPSISNKHLRVHCLIYDDHENIPPLVYATDLSMNGTVLIPSYAACSDIPPGKVRLTRKTGAYLLNDDDELQLSARVSLVFHTPKDQKYEGLTEVQQHETELFRSRYAITDRTLGRGGGGKVFVAVHLQTSRQLACKAVDISGFLEAPIPRNAAESPNTGQSVRPDGKRTATRKRNTISHGWFGRVSRFMREFDVVKDLHHPNIITIEKVFWSMNSLYIFQELITGGDLFSYIGAKGRLPDPEAAVIIRQILKAVEYLHNRGIAHRDLKPDNILMTSLDKSARIVVTDFGGARRIPCPQEAKGPEKVVRGRMHTVMGTLEYAAPEIYQRNKTIRKNQGYSVCVDMWSVGCIAATLLSGGAIFIQKDPEKSAIIEHMANCDLTPMEIDQRWNLVGQRPKDFIRKLLILNEDQRMTATEALAHPWFTNEHHAAALHALYENAVRGWRFPRKVFRMVEQLVPEATSHLGKDGLPKTFLPSPIISKFFSPPSDSRSQSSPNSLNTSQGRRANTPLPTITEEHELEQYGSTNSALPSSRTSGTPSIYGYMHQLSISQMEDALAETQRSESNSAEQYTYIDIADTDLNYDKQKQAYESNPGTPPNAAIPKSVPQTPARGVKRRASDTHDSVSGLEVDSQRSDAKRKFVTDKKVADEIAKRRKIP